MDIAERKRMTDEFTEKYGGSDELCKMFLTGAYGMSTEQEKLYRSLCTDIVGYETPSQYFRERYDAVVRTLAGDEAETELLYAYFDKLNLLQYSKGVPRRSVRSEVYLNSPSWIRDILRTAFYRRIYGVSLADFLLNKMPEKMLAYKQEDWKLSNLDDLIAAHLYAGDASVKNAVIEIINADNNTAVVTGDIIRGIIKSDDAELHALLGRLLVAARLQEGLRQTICENMDCGTVEAFTTLFDVIRDNGLLRFSSVKRAVATFIGMLDPEQLTRSSNKIFNLMDTVVHDAAQCRVLTASDDPIAVVVGLWGLGYREIDDAYDEMYRIAREGTGIQRQTAAYYNSMTEYYTRQQAFSCALMECGSLDIELAAEFFGEYMALWFREAAQCEGIDTLGKEKRPAELGRWFESPEKARRQLDLLTELLSTMKHKKYEFEPHLFPWHSVKLGRSDVLIRMAAIANGLGDRELIDRYAARLDEFDADGSARKAAVQFLLSDPKTKAQRTALIAALGNKEACTRNVALRIALKESFTPEEYAAMGELLRFKSDDLRYGVLELLKRQDEEGLRRTISRLLSDKREELRLGGLDLVTFLQDKGNDISGYKDMLTPTGEKEKLIYGRLFAQPKQAETLYTQKDAIEFSEIPYDERDYPLFSFDKETMETAFRKLSELIHEHRCDEYTNIFGEKVALGTGGSLLPLHPEDQTHKLAFLSLWKDFYEREIRDPRLLLAMNVSLSLKYDDDFMRGLFGETVTEGCFRGLANLERNTYTFARNSIGGTVLSRLLNIYADRELLHDTGKKVCAYVLRHTPADRVILRSQKPKLYRHTEYETILNDLGIYLTVNEFLRGWKTPEEFADVFRCRHALHARFNHVAEKDENTPADLHEMEMMAHRGEWINPTQDSLLQFDARGYIYAAYHGIITEAQMYWAMFELDSLREHFKSLFPWRKASDRFGIDDDPELKKYFSAVTDKIVDRVVAVEALRGDSETPFSKAVTAIGSIHGIEHLITLLKAMDKDSFVRSSCLGYVSGGSRSDNLSHLVSVSAPREDETAAMFAEAVRAAGIGEKRLIETAMYAPAWLDMTEAYLGYKGLKSAAYYFMAHMNDRYNRDEHKFAEIARYTPLDKEELFNGAFDRDWFREAYEALGEERFMLVYEAAKYVADGAKHTRARKYADACLGRINADEAETEIAAKRNKDLLMAYALIPFSGREELLHRYGFIQKFRRESGKFGAQRQTSERTACDMALRNLATLAGYSDVMRLTLAMESELAKSLVSYFEMRELDETAQAGLSFDENGLPELVFIKNGKKLASIPTAYKKNAYVTELKDAQKTFTEQLRRTVRMLEQAMEDRESFTCGEIRELRENPVLTELIDSTVFVCEGACGFLTEELSDTDAAAELRVAHPYDLYVSGQWREFQKRLFDRQKKQAFRQVFRELYLKLDEELASDKARMFAGHQLQPSRTLALLKKRRWMADEENGLQKIFYKDDIVAELYALADWFSPADIEPPTLEFVSFRDRRSLEPIPIEKVPPIVYSETMRDTDLAVSVAHAGAVDPETSHSTVEMRKVIVERNIELFGMKNVRVEGTHAYINGKLGEYSVQLGSGVTMLVGSHALNILPVHSQTRGRIFLPFLDEDPKTAEIVSKIVLLSADDKLKDPTVLEQIRR